jgi:hypothetical protein
MAQSPNQELLLNQARANFVPRRILEKTATDKAVIARSARAWSSWSDFRTNNNQNAFDSLIYRQFLGLQWAQHPGTSFAPALLTYLPSVDGYIFN